MLVAMCLIGCVTVPSTLDENGNVDPELVEKAEAAQKHNSAMAWVVLGGVLLGLVLAAKDSEDAQQAQQNCFFVVDASGSHQVCR